MPHSKKDNSSQLHYSSLSLVFFYSLHFWSILYYSVLLRFLCLVAAFLSFTAAAASSDAVVVVAAASLHQISCAFSYDSDFVCANAHTALI